MICSEISCDIVGFLACRNNQQIFSTAMLKFSTGLSQAVIATPDFFSQLQQSSFQQLDAIHESVFDPVLGSHPVTPLRLKLASLLSESDLVHSFGRMIAQSELIALKRQYNRMIDREVARIYPDIVPELDTTQGTDIAYDMCLAVALADGRVTASEAAAIRKIVGVCKKTSTPFSNLPTTLSPAGAKAITSRIVASAVTRAKTTNLRKADIVRLVKKMLVVAASDRIIEYAELDVIYDFAKEFGVTKQDIGILVNQLGLK